MSILSKGTPFGATEQVTSDKLNNLVDNAKFTNFSAAPVNYTGSTGTCLAGGGLEVTSNGQLQLQDGETDLVKLSTALKDSIHPVGIILETTEESTAAAFQTKIGFGTWEAYGEGRVTVAIDSSQTEFDTLGETSGAKTHTLSLSQIPNATGRFETIRANIPFANGVFTTANNTRGDGNTVTGGDSGSTVNFNLGGGGGSHNNLQPYIVVYRYRRTA